MPNWSMNCIKVTGVTDAIRELFESAQRGEFCNAVAPIPDMLKDTVVGSVGLKDSEQQLEHEMQQNLNSELFGYKNWCDFCIEQWGTKWDLGTSDTVNIDDNFDGTSTLTVSDDSAWSPPIGIFEKLHEQGFNVLAYYYEPGMGFCGRWHNGVDEYYQIQGNSDWVDEHIPNEISEIFAIAENMRQWEDSSSEEAHSE